MDIDYAIIYTVAAVPAIGITWYLVKKKKWHEKRATDFAESIVLGAILLVLIAITLIYS